MAEPGEVHLFVSKNPTLNVWRMRTCGVQHRWWNVSSRFGDLRAVEFDMFQFHLLPSVCCAMWVGRCSIVESGGAVDNIWRF